MGKYVIPDPPPPEADPLPKLLRIENFSAFRTKHPYAIVCDDGRPFGLWFSNLMCAVRTVSHLGNDFRRDRIELSIEDERTHAVRRFLDCQAIARSGFRGGEIMFSVGQKRHIATEVQRILRETNHPELPTDEITFTLHVEGAEPWSWADIMNNGAVSSPGVNPWNEIQAKCR